MKNTTLHELLILKLRSLYDSEQQISKALPRMAQRASNPDLKKRFEDHLAETKVQIGRLEKAFRELEEKPAKLRSEAVRGLIADAAGMMKSVKGAELDAALIAAAQYIEHYEIAGYGSAIAWAKEMGHDKVRGLLEESLGEEEGADQKLTALATRGVNDAADDM